MLEIYQLGNMFFILNISLQIYPGMTAMGLKFILIYFNLFTITGRYYTLISIFILCAIILDNYIIKIYTN